MNRYVVSRSTRFPTRGALTAVALWGLSLSLTGCAAGVQADASATESVAESSSPARSAPQLRAGSALVIFGADTVVVELARTAAERAQGLMYREEVPDGTGMLFVFEDIRVREFWMQNTYVDLDIAFMDENYTIIDIQQMESGDEETKYASAGPAMLALEVRLGWFAEHGIEVGATPEVIFGR